MYLNKQKITTALCTALLSAMISFTAQADDIEIYLGVGGNQLTYNPNVLFIMDSSGSMTGRDGTNESRLLRVQNALKDALRSATNINAGLMRFSDYGGPVLYPVRPIDSPVEPEIVTSVADSNDDAYEISGSVNVTSNRIKLVEGTTSVISGFRFDQLQIPRGAVISSAYLRLASDGFNSSAADIRFSAEASGNSAAFSSANTNISSRSKTAAQVGWSSDNDWPTANEQFVTPDIGAVIQEVVNRGDWCGGNALTLIVDGLGGSGASNRYIQSYDEGSGLGAELVVSYDKETATGCVSGDMYFQVDSQNNNAEEQSNGYQNTGSELTLNDNSNDYVGIRFDNVTIPQNAVVQEAYLTFTAYENRYGSASFDIAAVDEADPNDFNPYPRRLLRNKNKTASITWSGISNWYRNNTYQTPSLVNQVQAVVDRGDWESGNAMMFVLSNFDGNRGAYSYNGKPSGAPQLKIKFQGNAIPATVATVRDHLLNKVDELSADGLTPIVDTLYEAVSYYGGLDVYYGRQRGTSSVSSSVRRHTRVSNRMSYTGDDAVLPYGCSEDNMNDSDCVNEYIPYGATYISPVTDLQCQTNNHIVLLSDGEANNNHSVGEIESLLGRSCSNASSGEKCGIDLVKNISKSSESVIDARVITHTIGFAANATANNFLSQLALQGGGGFYTASDSDQLLTAFESILKSVKDVNATFVSPGVAVNQLNRLTHRDELYFALFKPAEGTAWPGNLKKYKIDGNLIKDKNGLAAVDDGTGFFKDTAHSYWSAVADGSDVREGGAASKLDLSRAVYTFSGTGNIADVNNSLHENNNAITAADLGVETQANPVDIRNVLLKWARGVDVKDDDDDGYTTDARLQMGDPIHSQPVIVNYGTNDSAIMVATNQGYLHSFDPETGDENFAIIPRELLPNLYDFYLNNSSFNHIYGMDGDMVLRETNSNKYLYVGMRRGGRNYYAFDITNKTSPSLAFKIEGGTGPFAKLGQSWSKPTVTKINIGGTSRTVLVFGGGYDEDQDNRLLRGPDTMGNAVFIVDADTGQLLWSASNSDADTILPTMQYSIPARISVIDRDGDDYADHLYVADTGGQIFRLDIHNGQSASNLVTGGLLASLANDDDATENRRFFYAPDVAEISLADEHYYAVAIGSGYRAHPLNVEIKDNIYMIKDKGVFVTDEDGNYSLPTTAFTAADLYDATAHALTTGTEGQQALEAAAFSTKQGWMISLGSGGEKVLATPLILNYKLFFTSYVPAQISESLCAPPSGNSRAYLVELINGNAVTDLNHNNQDEHVDRFVDLQQTGIAPETKVLIEDPTHPVVCLGTECGSIVKEVDEDGDEIACTTQLDCLAENIYGRLERVQKSAWKTETER
ncbi:pilus assembly protein PilY [Neptunicella sp. SCSIO 80796]|uniref:pilus assembly protein PilY n=1 Tax=Neptunicella plasticusilytica TaxID=3117012 RepID=UPI003A4D933E